VLFKPKGQHKTGEFMPCLASVLISKNLGQKNNKGHGYGVIDTNHIVDCYIASVYVNKNV